MLVELFASHHRVNPIPVVDDMQKVIGVVSRFDLVRFFADKDSFDGPSGLQTEAKEARVDQFLSDFEKRFVVVSKSRIKFWPLIGLLLIIAGFAIAMVTILRVVMK
jgi:CBS domain-containing protein